MMRISSLSLGAVSMVVSLAAPVQAQERIYRCGNEYTNNAAVAKERDCRLVEGGNITIVQGSAPRASAPASSASTTSSPARATTASSGTPSTARVNPDDQKVRDADAKAILEAELRKAEARLAELQKEYNQGQPERTALDLKNPAMYQGRVDALKEQITRAENDVAGIRRELGRRP